MPQVWEQLYRANKKTNYTMLTEDKSITTPEYWAKVYTGRNENAKVDASNTKRPANTFDRFKWLADIVDGPSVLDVASGHATTMKRLRAMHPEWDIICTDQTPAAREASGFKPYYICDAYALVNLINKAVTTVTISQALEYLEHPDEFMKGVKHIADYFVCTVPEGEMQKWSQLRIYTEESLKEWLSTHGDIVHFDKVPGLMLAKIKLK